MAFTSPCCPGCGASEPAPAFEPVVGSCRCGQSVKLALPVAAELRTPTVGAGLVANRRWLEALRARSAGGPFLLDACPRCSGPVTLPADTLLRVRCQYCEQTSELPLLEHAVDVLPLLKLSARTWGGGMDLRWAPEVRHGSVDQACACPHCSADLAPFVGSSTCVHCDGALFAFTACGRRFLPGIRVEGDDEGRRLGNWLPLPLALEHYQQRKALVRSSGRTTCAMFGVWLLFIPAFCVLGGVGVLVVGSLGERGTSPHLLVGGWFMLMLLPLVAFVSLITGAIVLHRRRRAKLTGGD